MRASLYFESHVTIEPIFDEADRHIAQTIASEHKFRLAELLMQKRREDTAERSRHDTFMTGHSQDYFDMVERTRSVVQALLAAGFKVWRYKVEDTLFDSRKDDYLQLLPEA